MSARWSNSWVSTLLVGGLVVGCSGAEWQTVEVASPYSPPKAVTIAVVARPVAKEAADALTAALVDELRSDGIAATVVSSANGAAEANVSIAKWEPGSRGLRWLAFGAGKGECVVTVDTATLGVDGTVHGWVKGGFFGGDSDNSASEAGRLIGKTIARGPEPQQGKTHED